MRTSFGVCGLAALILLLTGCPQWFVNLHTKRVLTKEEIVGSWSLTNDSLEQVRIDSGYVQDSGQQFLIQLHADGTYRLESIIQIRMRVPAYVTEEGTWSLTYSEEERRNVLQLTGKGRSAFSFDEDADGLILWTYWSDPDEGAMLRYRKNS